MFNVIEYSCSVRVYDRIDEYSDVKVFDNLDDIFKKYIDIDFVKGWFNIDEVNLDDVLYEKDGVYVMSVNEDMSLYIFKNESICNLIEDKVFCLNSWFEIKKCV